MPGLARIVRGNALDLPLEDNSVDLVCTSPPYFGLRSYQDNGEHYAGQIGSEATPTEFVDALIAATREMVRVTKPSGSIFVNLGDKYAGSNGGGPPSASSTLMGNGHKGGGPKQQSGGGRAKSRPITGAPVKSLIGIPWRYAIRCIDELGLILRAEMIWSKPNGLPESVTDRVRRSHETWFHFTKEPRYYSAIDEIREDVGRPPRPNERVAASGSGLIPGAEHRWNGTDGVSTGQNPLGKLPGSVWSIPTQPLKVPAELGIDHFAAFPMEWPRRIISGWSPADVCSACGEGRRPVSEHLGYVQGGGLNNGTDPATTSHGSGAATLGLIGSRRITGYACACPDNSAPSTPGVVLDPFGGTGTTALMARALGRTGISVDMSSDYCRLAAWRICDFKEHAKALKKIAEAKRVP